MKLGKYDMVQQIPFVYMPAGAYPGGFKGVQKSTPFSVRTKIFMYIHPTHEQKFLYSLYSFMRLSIYSALERIMSMWVQLITIYL